jgi:hypothetical protein
MCLGFLCCLEHLTVDPLQLNNRSRSSGPANRATRLTPLRVDRNRTTRDDIPFVLKHDFSTMAGPIPNEESFDPERSTNSRQAETSRSDHALDMALELLPDSLWRLICIDSPGGFGQPN